MRARLSLMVSNQRVQLREIILRDKPAEMLAVSEKATVPVLVLSQTQVIDESLDIMLWALKRNDPDNWLRPQVGTLEEMISLIQSVEENFKPHLDRFKYFTRYEDVDPAEHRQKALAFIEGEIETRLKDKANLFGNSYSLADYAIAPFARQYANADKEWRERKTHPLTLKWLDSFIESSLFKSIMEKHKPWQADDAVTIFP